MHLRLQSIHLIHYTLTTINTNHSSIRHLPEWSMWFSKVASVTERNKKQGEGGGGGEGENGHEQIWESLRV